MNARELVETARHKQQTSQAQLAKKLGISGASLSELAAGKKELSDETYIKLAELAGVNPTEVIIEKHMRKAGPEGRKVWAHLAKALPKSAALVVVLAFLTAQHQENQGNINISKFSNLANTYYVKLYS
jgi:transcriptional regulator with XRE-family HTH domain